MNGRRILHGVLGLALLALAGCASDSGGVDGAPVGRGGSTARFALVGDVLYTIAGSDLQLFRLDAPGQPAVWFRNRVNFDIETLYGFGNYLLIGSQSGVFIYDDSNPEFPSYVSTFTHATSCDPVVAQGNFAYVTLRGGTRCSNGLNQLDVVDLSVPETPQLVRSYPMQQPKGLGVDGDRLFVCDGAVGLIVFDVSIPDQPSVLQQLAEERCNDVIPNGGNLVVTSADGVAQYDYRQIPLQFISAIPTRP